MENIHDNQLVEWKATIKKLLSSASIIYLSASGTFSLTLIVRNTHEPPVDQIDLISQCKILLLAAPRRNRSNQNEVLGPDLTLLMRMFLVEKIQKISFFWRFCDGAKIDVCDCDVRQN